MRTCWGAEGQQCALTALLSFPCRFLKRILPCICPACSAIKAHALQLSCSLCLYDVLTWRPFFTAAVCPTAAAAVTEDVSTCSLGDE